MSIPERPLFGPAVASIFEWIGDLFKEWTGIFIW